MSARFNQMMYGRDDIPTNEELLNQREAEKNSKGRALKTLRLGIELLGSPPNCYHWGIIIGEEVYEITGEGGKAGVKGTGFNYVVNTTRLVATSSKNTTPTDLEVFARSPDLYGPRNNRPGAVVDLDATTYKTPEEINTFIQAYVNYYEMYELATSNCQHFVKIIFDWCVSETKVFPFLLDTQLISFFYQRPQNAGMGGGWRRGNLGGGMGFGGGPDDVIKWNITHEEALREEIQRQLEESFFYYKTCVIS